MAKSSKSNRRNSKDGPPPTMVVKQKHKRVYHGLSEEDHSMNSSSTDSTRPTAHRHRQPPPAATASGVLTDSSLSQSHSNEKDSRSSSRKRGSHCSNARQRVPGGAAAKLMLRGPPSADRDDLSRTSTSPDVEDYEEDDAQPIDTSEIEYVMKQTKVEFEQGRSKNMTITAGGDDNNEIEVSFRVGTRDANTNTKKNHSTNEVDGELTETKELYPHILIREEAYHENASAAVAAILNPMRDRGDSIATTSSAFQSSKYMEGVGSMANNSIVGGLVDTMEDDYDAVRSSGHKNPPTTEPLISEATEEKLDRMAAKMVDPSKTLSDLLRAIASPNDPTITMDRAFMVRRKNACGALKVLTGHQKRRKQICWTVGVLPALTSVLQDAGEGTLEVTYPDPRTRAEYEEARRRAISALTNLTMPQSNRLPVFHTPGLVQALIGVALKEKGEILQGTSAILAFLAKSPENKILMARVPGLFEAVVRVLKPQQQTASPTGKESKRRDYPWASSVSDSESSVSSGEVAGEDDDASFMSGSTNMYSDGETSDEEELDDEEAVEGEMEEFTEDEEEVTSDGESLTGSEASFGDSASMSEVSSEGEETIGTDFNASTIRSEGTIDHKRNHKNNVSSPKPPSKSRLVSSYDRDKYFSGARKNLFAMLLQLVKEKDNAYRLARFNFLISVLVDVSKIHESPIHTLAIQFLAHLSRHRLNSKALVFKSPTVVPALVKATYANNELSRRYACFAIQNFSHDKTCRQELASSEKLIVALCKRARHSKDPEERLAAINALKNLTDEPANLIPLSNTAECIATLMQIAHGQEEGVSELMQFRACDALATISHWLRKIATNGQSMDAVKHGDIRPNGMFIPSLKVIGWEQYE